MAALKIVFVAGDRQIVLYGQGMKQMWQVESHVLERLGEEERLKLDTAQFRKYWIDEEGDRVEIMNDVDYEFFLKRAGSHRTPKIYFEARYPEKQQQQEAQSSTSSPQRGRENLSVHRTVSCDMCNVAPVVGFRYKCLQCPNFDLCMNCEGQMKHPEHLMLRIPNSDAPILESMCPMTATMFGNKRRQRKYAAAAAAASAAAAAAAASGAGVGICGEEAQTEGKSRHHRHHRRHCAGGTGIWSNFYDMMQDLAEGGAVTHDSAATETPQKQQQQQQEASAPPQPEATTTEAGTSAAAAAATVNSQSKETNTSPDRSSASAAGAQSPPRFSASAPPSFENLQNFIDPHFMKAGIQILNNFSEMFGKILDPVVTTEGSVPTSSPGSVVIDLTAESHASATPPPTATGTPSAAARSKETSAAGSGIVTPMETEVSPPSTTVAPEALPRSRNSQSEENDWTMIDNNVSTSTTVDANTATTAAASSPPLDFAKLSQQLQSHIENEMKEQTETTASAPATPVAIPTLTIPATPSPAPIVIPVAAPAPIVTPAVVPPPTTPDTTERRAVAVFHPDARINNAVHAMMAMGFSNEGAMLTQLLESVNGSIPLALDLMSAAQRN